MRRKNRRPKIQKIQMQDKIQPRRLRQSYGQNDNKNHMTGSSAFSNTWRGAADYSESTFLSAILTATS